MSCDEIKYPISESAVVSLYKYPNFRKRGSAFIRSAGTLYPRFFAAVGAPVFVLSPPPGGNLKGEMNRRWAMNRNPILYGLFRQPILYGVTGIYAPLSKIVSLWPFCKMLGKSVEQHLNLIF